MKKSINIKLIAFAVLFFLYNIFIFTPINATETTSSNNVSLPVSYSISYTLYPGQKVTLDFNTDNSHTMTSYYFSVGGIAAFKDNVIIGVNSGKTTLFISYADGSSCTVYLNIKKGIKKIDIPQKKIRLNKKDSRWIYVNVNTKGSDEPLVWKSSNNKVVTVDNTGKITGKKKGTAYITCKSQYSGKSDRIKVYVKKTKYIAFTFDDGPSIYTEELLDVLKKYNSRATFFVLGERVKKYPELIEAEAEYGHQVENHTYDHPILPRLEKSDIKSQIKKTNKLINKTAKKKSTLFRPPYGSYNKTVLKAAKKPIILWSVDTLDWKNRNSDYIKKAILSNAGDGEIVLLHDIYGTSVEGFKKAIKKLKKQNYELVTVEELFEIKGVELKNGKVYYSCK